MIQESDLTEGLRVLIKLEGHFYPGQIQAISPPDIYGVLVDRERGNKPHIFSREEVLQDAVSFIFCIYFFCLSFFLSFFLSCRSLGFYGYDAKPRPWAVMSSCMQ